jgi:hypothetical protein
MTSAVDTIIQAVSPEFRPSEASAEEDGTASRTAIVSKRLTLIFMISPLLE